MSATITGLDPNFMQTILVYAFAAAVLGGLDSPGGRGRRGIHPRRRDQPALDVRRLRDRVARARAADRARRAARRPSGQAGRDLRSHRDEARLAMPRVRANIVPAVALAVGVGVIAVMPAFLSDYKASNLSLVGHLLHRHPRAQRRHGLQRADLARTGGVHGHRRVHDGDLGRPGDERLVDDPCRCRGGRRDRIPVRVPRASASWPVPRARDVRARCRVLAAHAVRPPRVAHRRRSGDLLRATDDAVLRDVGDRARAPGARVVRAHGQAREVVSRGPRRRAGRGLVRPQPRGLQDGRLRHRGGVRAASPAPCSRSSSDPSTT